MAALRTTESPRRTPLGTGFARLWGAAIASNLADGLGRTAVPLIATTLTRDPALIAGIAAAAYVPWLVFGIPAGMLLDRVDRRIAMAVAIGSYAVGALGVAVWNVPWAAVRQAIIPSNMLGRAVGIIRTIGWGLTPVATILGGFVARVDLRLPFLIGGAIVAVLAILCARLVLSADAQGALED